MKDKKLFSAPEMDIINLTVNGLDNPSGNPNQGEVPPEPQQQT